MSVSKETATVKFNPKTKNFHASFNTTPLVTMGLSIAILMLAVLWKIDTLKAAGVALLFLLMLPLCGVIYAIAFPTQRVAKAANNITVVGFPREMLTQEVLENAVRMFLNPSQYERMKLPEPDAKFDAEQDKTIPLTPEEKKAIVAEQVDIVEKIEVSLAEGVKQIAQEQSPKKDK
jgi:hypothetical protein